MRMLFKLEDGIEVMFQKTLEMTSVLYKNYKNFQEDISLGFC